MSARDDIMKRRGASTAPPLGDDTPYTLTEEQVARRERQSEPDTPLPRRSWTRARKATPVMEPGATRMEQPAAQSGQATTTATPAAPAATTPTATTPTQQATAAPILTEEEVRRLTDPEPGAEVETPATTPAATTTHTTAKTKPVAQTQPRVGSFAELVRKLYPKSELSEEEKRKQERRRRSEAIISAFGDGAVAVTNLIGSMNQAPAITEGPQLSERSRARWEQLKKERQAKRDQYYEAMLKAAQLDESARRADDLQAYRDSQLAQNDWYKEQRLNQYADRLEREYAELAERKREFDEKQKQAAHNQQYKEERDAKKDQEKQAKAAAKASRGGRSTRKSSRSSKKSTTARRTGTTTSTGSTQTDLSGYNISR